nr:AI-2E family transporter [uncultured Anaerostipes sp.]
MKYFKENDKTPFVVVAFGICLFFLLDHLSLVIQGITYIGSVAFPFIVGSCLAFIINVPMRFFEKRVLRKVKKGRRVLSLIAAILCIIGVILLVCGLIIPELANTMYRLSLSIPGFVQTVQDYIENMSRDNPRIHSYVMSLDVNWNQIGGQLMGYFQTWATNLLNSTVSIISSAVQVIVSFALGFVFALNALLKKETLAVQVKKLLLAFLPLKVVKHIVRIGRLSNQAFSNFLSGQCIEAVILGCLIFTCMKILGMPYAVLIAVFIGVSSLIPIVGAFVGCGIGVLLILTVDWKQAIVFVVMFLVVQQFEGNVIYPHVVGNSVGLPGMWVLVAVTIGGNVAGVVGMLFSIPLFSVVYQLLTEGVNWQIRKRGLEETVRKV